MEQNIKEVLLSREEIQARVQELAKMLSDEYADKDPVFVGVLKGVVVFFADMSAFVIDPKGHKACKDISL